MHKKNTLVYGILTILLLSLLTINVVSEKNDLSHWNNDWLYKEEIKIPISTSEKSAKYQPIDIHFEFKETCWGKNELEHSIRICCWNENRWYELESQIYKIEYEDSTSYIKKCGIIFLIPGFANGKERYFVYYDENEKPKTNYDNHVDIADEYYYYEPISGISAEGDYYKITEEGFCVFGIGQKGKVFDRKLSQTVIKIKPNTKEFDITRSDAIANYCFSYFKGEEDEDEISSDDLLTAKQILIDGTLMVEFRIISESEQKNIRTSNIYKYYYCPTDDKRINVHVKHEVLNEDYVEGNINIDGRYGSIISFESKSETIKKMRFGEILPYLHVYHEDNNIREYLVSKDPEGKKREWIISYEDDCDLGEKTWFSYDEGKTGKAQGVILKSNLDIIKYSKEDRDGIQIKAVEKEYMDVLGTEIDYVAINFGRNSYEKNGMHDLKIRQGLTVEYDAEFFISENGGYPSVESEAKIYQELIKYRNGYDEGPIDEEQKIHTLTVVPRFTGRIMSHPFLSNITGIKITSVYAELYKNDEFLSKKYTHKPFLDPPKIIFPKLSVGEYIIKIYREIGEKRKMYIGFGSVNITSDETISVYCTWPKEINVHLTDQNYDIIKGFKLSIIRNNTIVDKHIFSKTTDFKFTVPANIFFNYELKGYYKGFEVFSKEIIFLQKKIEQIVELYNLNVDVFDDLGFSPGVDIQPYLSSFDMINKTEIQPDEIITGQYIFKNLPNSRYTLHLSYGSYSKTENINIDSNDKNIELYFNALYNLNAGVLDSRGNNINKDNNKINIYRDGKKVKTDVQSEVALPPGEYQIKVLSDDGIIAFKNIIITNDKNIKIVTDIDWVLPIIVNILVNIFLIETAVVFLLKRISLNSFLKIVAMALILLSIFQPWWSLNAINEKIDITKTSDVYILPQVMIEKITIDNQDFFDLATIPEVFTDFLGILLLIVVSGFVLIGISFIPNILLKKRYSIILIVASASFLILIAVAFTFGMSKITELTLGSLQGQGFLNVDLPDKSTDSLYAYWGLGSGFYLCIFAALMGLLDGIIDLSRKQKWFKSICNKIKNN